MKQEQIITNVTYQNHDEKLGDPGEFTGKEVLKQIEKFQAEGHEVDVDWDIKEIVPIYTVSNSYGIVGESNHRTPEAALKAAQKREGRGPITARML